MKIKTEGLSAALLAPLLFIGCGGNARIDEDVSLSSENYITVAKTVYAQQNGENKGLSLQKATPAQTEKEEGVLYLNKAIKPRNHLLTDVEVTQDNKQLSIKVDAANKYATVTLSGDESAQQTIDMKSFTLSE